MADLMIDLEGLGTGPDTTILTIAAQSFDPLGSGYHDKHYYARITLESQENRSIQKVPLTGGQLNLLRHEMKHLMNKTAFRWIKPWMNWAN